MGRNAKDKKAAAKKADAAAPAGPLDSKQIAENFKEKGNQAFVASKFDVALECYQKAIEEDSKNPSLYSNRSATYCALRKYDNALKDAQTTIELKPEWGKGFLRLGNALEGLLRYGEAKDAYLKGLSFEAEDKNLKAALDELNKLLDELKITEQQLSANANPDSDKFETMVKWMKDNGAKFPMLYMQYYSEDYRGVHALTKIPPSQIILYVPLSIIMTSEVAKESVIGSKIIKAGVDLRSKHSYLAAYLCQEKHNPNSFWKPYMDVLPQHYRNMPIFFTPEELQWLKGSFTLDKIADRVDSLRKEYENIKRAVPEFGRYTHNEFVWARLVVITRIFGLNIDGKKTDGLVAYADMLNHKRPREDESGDTKWTYDEEMKGFTITSLRTINRGEEVYDSYGRKCNSRFFVNYGFTLEENEDNEVVIRVAMPKDDPHYALKVRYLGGREASANREFQVPATYKEKKTRELFSFLRFVHARDEEVLALPTDGLKNKKSDDDYEDREAIDDIDPLSIRNELAVLRHLRISAEAVMAGFDTTLEHDLELLKKPRNELNSNIRNCVVMRAGEKTVLRWFIDLANNMSPLLQTPWKDLKKVAAKAVQGTSAVDYYITQVVVPLVKKHGS